MEFVNKSASPIRLKNEALTRRTEVSFDDCTLLLYLLGPVDLETMYGSELCPNNS